MNNQLQIRLRKLAVIIPLLSACSRGSGERGNDAARAARGAVVARVGGVELREDDVRRAMARDPGASSARFDSPTARRELVEGLVRFELLAQAAERAGLTKDPDAIHAMQQIAVTKLVNENLGNAAAPDAITSADVQRDYEAHLASDFTLPEAKHLRHIRVSDENVAARLAAQARALAADDDAGFAALASSHSEDTATLAGGGDLGFIDANSRQPPAIVQAASELETPGQVVGPLKTSGGYEILRLVALRAAAVSPLSSVEEQVRQRLYRERRAQALDDFIAKLRKETPVEFFEQ